MVRVVFKSILLSGLLFLSGCATLYNPATGRNELILINSATEIEIGNSVKADLTKKHHISQDTYLNNRLNNVGNRLAAVSDRKDIEYRFFVLEDKDLNALAIPGGQIYVYQGLMNVLDDDELAYVVGHEVGHVAARHIAKRLQGNMAYQLLLAVAFAGFSDKLGDNAQSVAQGIDQIYNLIDLGYSRQDEYEADRLAVKYSYKSGYNPNASLTALEKIKKGEGPNWKVLGYFRSHPYIDERTAALRKIL